jgi:hypothetical protein
MIGPRMRLVMGLARIMLTIGASLALAIGVPVVIYWALR